MRIACPSCDAEYEVPESMLAGRSIVRCARCGEEWRPGAEPAAETLPVPAEGSEVATIEEASPPSAPPAAVPPAAASQPGPLMAAAPMAVRPLGDPADRPTAVAEAGRPPSLFVPPRARNAASSDGPSGGGRAVLVGWVLTLLVIAGALYAGYAYRAPIMAAWPPSARLYAALGLR